MSKTKGGRKSNANLFKIGDEVMGKWPGIALWYEAVILDINDERNKFKLRFTDGQENVVPLSSIAQKMRFRARSTSPSRRSTSPARRRRSRSKSPSRKKKSPRKSTSPAKSKRTAAPKPAPKVEDREEKPPAPEGTVTVTTRTKVLRTPPRTAVGQQLEARVTRSALRQLEKHGVDTEKLRQELGKGLGDEKPKTNQRGYEFGGPWGVVFMTYALPLFVFASYFYCNKKCYHLSQIYKNPFIKLPSLMEFLDPQAAALVYGWIAFQAFLSILPIGKVVEGMPLKDKTKLKYRTNGFQALVFSLVGFAACIYYKVPVTSFVYNKFLGLITHAILCSFVLSILLFLKALTDGTDLSEGGSSGNPIYDFFMGKQLNPRFFTLDLKFFFELRPGLIGLVLIDLVMAVKLWEQSHDLNNAMGLICLFHIIYVADSLWFEESVLTMPDITREGFGFMLAFGDIVWVPFMYSLQARFLVDHPHKIPTWLTVVILALNGIGFIIYRVANLQKYLYRRNPNHPAVQHLETMPTGVSGKHLLVSGWWGYVRHPTYLGDLIMSVAWSLTCGFTHIIPYFYPIFLVIMLVHRCCREEASCRQKYGRSWDEYCKIVPYRLFPNIF